MRPSPRHAALTTLKAVLGVTVVTAVTLACGAGTAQAATNAVVFNSPGEHAVVVPAGVTSLHVVATGGAGGRGDYQVDGGFGAQVAGDVAVTPGSTLYLVVGGNGEDGTNHGGAGGGGGASDVRTLPVSAGLTPTDSRRLVAAGGGGAGRGFGHGAGGSAGYGGNGNAVGGDSRQNLPGSEGGAPGVPTGTGLGGAPGGFGHQSGAAGTLGVGGAGSYVSPGAPTRPASGGYNGGGVGGGYSSTVFGQVFTYYGGGGGGGGLHGGGGGGGVSLGSGTATGGGGGGGGSNLVPAGGSTSTGTTRAASISVSFTDNTAPLVSLDAIPAWVGPSTVLTGDSTIGLGQGDVVINAYAGSAATGVPVGSRTASSRQPNGRYSASAPSLGDGQYTMQATQTDGAGNRGVSVARTFRYDGTAPLLSITAPADNLVTNDPTLQFAGVAGTASGDDASVSVDVLPNVGNVPVATINAPRHATTGAYAVPASPALADGTYRARARQADAAGNVGAAPQAMRFTVDTHAPAPTLVPPSSSRTNDATPTFTGTGTTDDRDESAVVVRVFPGTTTSGSPVATLNGTRDAGDGRYEVTGTTPLPDGTYTVQTTQSDSAGNAGSSGSHTFTVDTTAPAVSLADPSAGAKPTFAGTGGTAVGDLAAVTVTVRAGTTPGGTVVQTLTTTRNPTTGAFNVPASATLPVGMYSVRATQADDLGNTRTSAVRTVVVADSAPPITPPDTPGITGPPVTTPLSDAGLTTPITSPIPSPSAPTGDRQAPVLSKVSLSRARFRVGAAAGRARLARGTVLRYRLDERATLTVTITRSGRAKALGTVTHRSATGAGRLTISGRVRGKALRPGRYRMTIRATDAAGNRGAAKTIGFRVG